MEESYNGYLGDKRAVEPLLHALLTDSEQEVRASAAKGLGRWDDPRAVQTLLQALCDPDSHVRSDAAEMLNWLTDERAIDGLLHALGDSEREMRVWSIEALWSLCLAKGDARSAEAQEKLRASLPQALQDEESEVQESAKKMLAWLA